MATTVIYAHPYEGSFNPVYSKEELALFNQGQVLDPSVQKYQQMIKESRRLIFIFPIWWADMPAIVKGFLDKVLLKQFAYVESKTGLSGRMGRGMAGAAQSGRMRRQKLLSAGTMDYVFSLLGIDGVGRTGPLKRPAVPALLVPRLFGD